MAADMPARPISLAIGGFSEDNLCVCFFVVGLTDIVCENVNELGRLHW